ncbi:MAG TPA: ParB/Srx family N-terminal domain-containing protein [Chitinophagaceae bacterium]|nr:ParB/Srx family N-terminal domain-containing protein [Chitinophagaceae bacterium]
MKIDDLQFDRLNPRFLRRFQEKDDKDIIEWMLSDATLFDLIASIGTYDFYPGEPLLIIESEQHGKYIVIAGNRRLACCKIQVWYY